MRVRQVKRKGAYLIGYETERCTTYYEVFCRQKINRVTGQSQKNKEVRL